MTNYTVTTQTPVGPLTLTEHNGHITQCQFTKAPSHRQKTSALLRTALSQLDEYFTGQRSEFDLPIATSGTFFQENIWATLLTIPYGEQWSYQKLAQQAGKPKAHRAAGSANAQNPICIIIPCHRVVLSSGKSGSYAGGDDVKLKLLDLERS